MMKLLIVDDEMLVLVGIKSMIDWASLGIEIAGTAHNGSQALEMIDSLKPDIVLIDINMPVKNGLEVAKDCREKGGKLPLFIFLTSYEEFSYAREAVSVQAFDYLVKLSLTPELLENTMRKAVAAVQEIKAVHMETEPGAEGDGGSGEQTMAVFKDRFFLRLYNNIFDSPDQIATVAEELGITLPDAHFAVVFCNTEMKQNHEMTGAAASKLYTSTMQIVQETVSKYASCFLTGLDPRHFAVLVTIPEAERSSVKDFMTKVLLKVQDVVFSYFSVELQCSVGVDVDSVKEICNSYHSAYQTASGFKDGTALLFAPDFTGLEPELQDEKKHAIVTALETLQPQDIKTAVQKICAYFTVHVSEMVAAMDCACTLLYSIMTMVPDGEEILDSVFSDQVDSYRCLYRQHTVNGIVSWMEHVCDGLCAALLEKRQTYKEHIIESVQEYIRINIEKRLSLNDVAVVFGFTPNYLSQLFTKSSETGFVEYVTAEKIAAAKRILKNESDIRIYELAERLGFESAFYFSTVFKKVAGCTPSEYKEQLT